MTGPDSQPLTQPALDPDEVGVQDTCKDCAGPFALTRAAVDFFEDRRLELPKRCVECRRKRRERREEAL